MPRYRITVETLDNPTDEPSVRVIEFQTTYAIQRDLTEWVRAEIDADAKVTDAPVTGWVDMLIRETKRQIDTEAAGIPPVDSCFACQDDNHEDCPDNGLSAAPYWCQCAANRHGAP